MAIDTTFFKQPNETIDQYNTRIAVSNPNLPAPGSTSSSGITNTAISGTTLEPQKPYQLPTQPSDTTNYQGMIAGGNALIGANNAYFNPNYAFQAQPTENAPAGTPTAPTFEDYTKNLPPPPSASEQYNTDYSNAGIETKQSAYNTDVTALQKAQEKLAGINSQLAGINAETQAIPVRNELNAEGRGITQGGLAPITAGQLRMNALRALPLQAQALAAQAEVAGAQGRAQLSQSLLEQAQQHLDKVYQIHISDATNRYDYETKLREMIFQNATAREKTRLEQLQHQADQNFALLQNNLNHAQTLQVAAINAGQADIAGKIAALDPHATNYQQQVAALAGQIKAKSEGVWSKTYQLGNNYVQKNNLTGEIRTASSGVAGGAGNYVPGSNPTVDNWARLIIAGQASITQVPNPRGSMLRSQVVDAITNSGQVLLSDKDREKLSTLDTAFNVANTIKDLSSQINTFGPGGRISGYIGRQFGAQTQTNPTLARYEAARQGFVSNVARTLGEKGTLAEGDVQRAISNLPTINDTKDVAEGKLKTLFSILEGAKASIVQKSTEPFNQTTSGTLPQGSQLEELRNKYGY